ncbi:MAG TPA: ATP-grasp domain-containing protein [Kineosporiaceae bacterium]|jgi:biotin carboxylase|nr:ATP-grasp domain-containing protein [Kineosporiaceae bacterium]
MRASLPVVVLGDPQGSRVGRHMAASYLAEVGEPYELHVLGRDDLPTGEPSWPQFAEALRRRVASPAIVFTGQEDLVELAAYLSAGWGLPHHPAGVGDRVRLKEVCRDELRKAGLPQPRSALVDGREGLTAFVAGTDGPWIVKPRDARGSTDVHFLGDVDRLGEVAALMQAYPTYVVEQFVAGPEFSVEGVFVAGRPCPVAVTQKTLFPGAGFVEMVHQQPPSLDAHLVGRLAQGAADALVALGACTGLFHVEAWLTEGDRVVVGEVHLRSGGDWIHALTSWTRSDAPLFRLAVDDAAGRAEVPSPPRACGAGAAARFVSAEPGVATFIPDVDEIALDPSALHVEVFVDVGDVVSPLRSSDDRVGVVVARGESGADAAAQAERLAARLQVETRPTGPVPARR